MQEKIIVTMSKAAILAFNTLGKKQETWLKETALNKEQAKCNDPGLSQTNNMQVK